MTGRERILAVLNRKTPDRVPFEIGGTDCSSVHILAYKRLRERLGLPDKPIKCGCLTQLIADFDEDVREALAIDAEFFGFAPRETKIWETPFGVQTIVPEKFDCETLADGSTVARNAQGIPYSKMAADAYYFDPVGTPLAHISSPDELDDFDELFERWDYSYVYDEPLEDMIQRAEKRYTSTSRAIIANWQLHFLQAGQFMRGYEQFLVDLMVEKDLAHALLGKLQKVYLKRVDTFLNAYKDSLDIVFLTDDLGTQLSCLISPATYQEMIMPLIAEIIRKIKSFDKKIIIHSCGAVTAFIPFFIEMGIDALNPVQVSAAGMSPQNLVKEFGKDIAFWGGGCDTQNALNSSALEIVRENVRKNLQEFGPEASLVFTQVHNIQYDVSPENILAMRNEFFKYVERN